MPSRWAPWECARLIGDLFTDKLRFPCPAATMLCLVYPDQEAASAKAGFKFMRTTSLAGKHLISPAITLDTHVTDVTNLIETEGLTDFVLAGHSYGGMVITETANRLGDRIRALVYVDAFLPRDGEALWDIADDPSRKHYIDAQRDMPGLVAPFPGSPSFLTRHPLLTLLEPVRTTPKAQGIAKRTYVYATKGAPTVFTKFHARVADDPAWKVHSVDAGHGVMQEKPEETTAILLEAAL